MCFSHCQKKRVELIGKFLLHQGPLAWTQPYSSASTYIELLLTTFLSKPDYAYQTCKLNESSQNASSSPCFVPSRCLSTWNKETKHVVLKHNLETNVGHILLNGCTKHIKGEFTTTPLLMRLWVVGNLSSRILHAVVITLGNVFVCHRRLKPPSIVPFNWQSKRA